MKFGRMAAAFAAAVLVIAGCGDDDDGDEVESTTTTEASEGSQDEGTDESDDSEADEQGADELGIGACSSSQLPSDASYVVSGIPADDPDGGLVARMLPGADEEQIDVLAEGTVVDTLTEADACATTGDGAVWWDIGTPQLATGGWVNSSFLEATGSSGPPDTDQDSYDLEKAQIACIYEGEGGACDILEQDGYTADGNYGLGNSYSMAPDDDIADQCDAGDEIACAEQEFRKGGGE